jgi:hypothetical protein
MSTNRKDKNAWGTPLMEISTVALITNIPLTSWGNEMKFTEKIEKELIYSINQNL